MSSTSDQTPRPSEPGVANGTNDISSEVTRTVEQLLTPDPRNSVERGQRRQQVESLALQLQRESASSTHLLEYSLGQASSRSGDESSVVRSLGRLQEQIELIDPSSLDSQQRWTRRLLRWVFGIDTPLKRYLDRYESARIAIGEVLSDLQEGREELRRDNITLAAEQDDLQQINQKLRAIITFVERVRDQLTVAREREIDHQKTTFIEQDLLFPLNQRALDLHQQIAVNQQGILAIEMILRNNQELARGVDSALYITANSLRIATSVAVTLADQVRIRGRIRKVSSSAKGVLEGTTKMLKSGGASKGRQAVSGQLSLEKLKEAITEMKIVIEEIEGCRTKAVPAIAESIHEVSMLRNDFQSLLESKRTDADAAALAPIDLDLLTKKRTSSSPESNIE